MIYCKTIDNKEDMVKYGTELFKRRYSHSTLTSLTEINRQFDAPPFLFDNANQIIIGMFDEKSIVGYITGQVKEYENIKVGFREKIDIFYTKYQTHTNENVLYSELNKWLKDKNCDLFVDVEEDNFDYDKYKEKAEHILAVRNEIIELLDDRISSSQLKQCNIKDSKDIENIMTIYFKDEKINFRNKPLYKKCNEIYNKYLNNEISTEDYNNQLDLLGIDIRSFALDYAFYIEGKSKAITRNMILRESQNENPKTKILNLISSTDDENEIYVLLSNYAKNSGNNIINILLSLQGFINFYLIAKYKWNGVDASTPQFRAEEVSLNKKISNVIKIYRKKYNEELKIIKEKEFETKLPELLKNAQKIVNDFMSKDISLEKYLKQNGISMNDYKKLLNLIEENDIELYQNYCEYMNHTQSQRFAVLMNKTDLIVNYIKNGIINEETNKKREFDILDYYIKSNITPEDFIKLSKNKCSADDYRLVRKFFAKNENLVSGPKIVNEIRKSTMIVNNVEVTDEQKEDVIRYLRKINAPFSTKLFKIAMRRYLNNELNIEKEDNNNLEHVSKNR